MYESEIFFQRGRVDQITNIVGMNAHKNIEMTIEIVLTSVVFLAFLILMIVTCVKARRETKTPKDSLLVSVGTETPIQTWSLWNISFILIFLRGSEEVKIFYRIKKWQSLFCSKSPQQNLALASSQCVRLLFHLLVLALIWVVMGTVLLLRPWSSIMAMFTRFMLTIWISNLCCFSEPIYAIFWLMSLAKFCDKMLPELWT